MTIVLASIQEETNVSSSHDTSRSGVSAHPIVPVSAVAIKAKSQCFFCMSFSFANVMFVKMLKSEFLMRGPSPLRRYWLRQYAPTPDRGVAPDPTGALPRTPPKGLSPFGIPQ
jgi:hypothetical protein